MDLCDFRYFVRTAETGSISKAAGQLSIAQSALSRRMRDLEHLLGVSLFYRNGRGVVLTDQGRVFLDRIRSILGDIDQLQVDLRATQTTVGGLVTLGVPPSVGLVLLAPLLTQLRQDHPAIQMRVLEGFSGHVAEWLVDGRIDLAVLYKVRANALLDAEHLLFEDMYLISSIASPKFGRGGVPLARLDGLPLALPGRPHGLRVLMDDAFARAEITPDIALELETLPTIKDLVAAGTVHSVLPLAAVRDEVERGILVASRIIEPTVSRELTLAHAPQRASAPATRLVASMIRAHIDTLVRSERWTARI
jgi:LysR family nitrogen assimilation transcriptional regulator